MSSFKLTKSAMNKMQKVIDKVCNDRGLPASNNWFQAYLKDFEKLLKEVKDAKTLEGSFERMWKFVLKDYPRAPRRTITLSCWMTSASAPPEAAPLALLSPSAWSPVTP
jgi:hypothetical protein